MAHFICPHESFELWGLLPSEKLKFNKYNMVGAFAMRMAKHLHLCLHTCVKYASDPTLIREQILQQL